MLICTFKFPVSINRLGKHGRTNHQKEQAKYKCRMLYNKEFCVCPKITENKGIARDGFVSPATSAAKAQSPNFSIFREIKLK